MWKVYLLNSNKIITEMRKFHIRQVSLCGCSVNNNVPNYMDYTVT